MSTSRFRLLSGSAPLVLAKAAASQVFGQVTVGVDPVKPVVKASDIVVKVR